MTDLGIAIVGGFIGGLGGIIGYYYNLKKERFFNLQGKGEELLQHLYHYQEMLLKTDISSDNLEMLDEPKNKNELKPFLHEYKVHENLASEKQRVREHIWAIIVIYFPSIEKQFREYTMIEIYHNPEKEYNIETMNMRENKLHEISESIIGLINKERNIFLRFKV